ncbi:regulatory protein GemA [Arenimonas sp.]|uniref:gp16 family protein n=1 Tax=Arenimonas sp. TaxID=1872635 RepID=UPI0025C3E609|nr:regulatory protein GemA [Arenimonas sp.]
MATRALGTGDQLRKRELAQIHLAKAALQMDDDGYRAMLWTIARVRSAADLDWTGRKRVLDHMVKCGWKNNAKRPADPVSRKIRSQWLTLRDLGALTDPSEKALRSFVKRTAGVERMEWLTASQAATVIEALKAWVARLETPK